MSTLTGNTIFPQHGMQPGTIIILMCDTAGEGIPYTFHSETNGCNLGSTSPVGSQLQSAMSLHSTTHLQYFQNSYIPVVCICGLGCILFLSELIVATINVTGTPAWEISFWNVAGSSGMPTLFQMTMIWSSRGNDLCL